VRHFVDFALAHADRRPVLRVAIPATAKVLDGWCRGIDDLDLVVLDEASA
jgi:hypothetical protein